VYTYIKHITLSYKRILYIEVARTNYLANSLDIFAGKTLIPSSGVPFTYLSINKKLYYNDGLSLNRNIGLTSIGL